MGMLFFPSDSSYTKWIFVRKLIEMIFDLAWFRILGAADNWKSTTEPNGDDCSLPSPLSERTISPSLHLLLMLFVSAVSSDINRAPKVNVWQKHFRKCIRRHIEYPKYCVRRGHMCRVRLCISSTNMTQFTWTCHHLIFKHQSHVSVTNTVVNFRKNGHKMVYERQAWKPRIHNLHAHVCHMRCCRCWYYIFEEHVISNHSSIRSVTGDTHILKIGKHAHNNETKLFLHS